MRDSKKSAGSTIRRTEWPRGADRPLVTPLHMSVVYGSDNPDALDNIYEGQSAGYTYAREAHPNAEVLARKIDAMEHVQGGIITGSGMAAVTAAIMGLLKAGDHVVGADQLYGRSLRLLGEDLPRLGVETSLADPTNIRAVADVIHPNTRMILLELVSNPTLRVADITGIARLAKERGILLVLDNTFTTPHGFQPFDHGADIVVHSITKLLAGHSDVTLGYVVAKDRALQKAITGFAVTTGLTASPFDCWLAERGLHTFALRYDRAAENAERLADVFVKIPNVIKVLYPTRADHPDHNSTAPILAGKGGNMLSFEITGGRDAANRLVNAAKNIVFAPTLGDVGTVLSHPASSSHRALTAAQRTAIGISEGFFRVSVGVEDFDLLAEEFSAAITAAS